MPTKPANRCTQCRKLHNGVGLCRSCRRITNVPYQKSKWEQLRDRVLSEEPICRICRNASATVVDHIMPIRDGGNPYNRSNCQGLCKSCHSRKTNLEQQGA